MEQHIGHRSYADNLRREVERRRDVVATWIPVDYAETDRWWERLPLGGAKSVLRARAEVRQGVDVSEPGTSIVFNTQVPAVLAGRRARARPYVLCTDVTPIQYDRMAAGYGHRADRPGPVRWLKHRRNLSVFRGAVAHAPWSNWVRSSLVADYQVDPQRIEVVPPGVDLTRWRPASHDDPAARILFVGGDFARKGGDVLLRAFAGLPNADAELRVVTKESVARQDRVKVYNHLSEGDPELLDLYRTSNVFVLPSRAETFGIAAVEAGASGLPLVVSAVGGLAELVVDGVTGYGVEPGSVEGLRQTLQQLMDDPVKRRTMGHAARSRAEREFDVRDTADRLVRLAVPTRTA
jgi:glycosyltransferase involved in cell wall biosynthesis